MQKILIVGQKNQTPPNLKYFGYGTLCLCTLRFESNFFQVIKRNMHARTVNVSFFILKDFSWTSCA